MKRLLALVTVLVPLAALAELVDRIAAVVDNDVITQSEVEARAAPELARLRPDPDPAKRGEKRQEILKHALEGLIGEKLMEAQIRELNIEVTDSGDRAGHGGREEAEQHQLASSSRRSSRRRATPWPPTGPSCASTWRA